jgi:hypothetical protein
MFIYLFIYLAVLRIELRVSSLLGKPSTTLTITPVLLLLVCFSDRVLG